MDDQERVLAEAQAVVESLPAAEREKVMRVVLVIESAISLGGEHGTLALALVGARAAVN